MLSSNKAGKINTDFFALAKTIISNDARQFKTQHPEYSAAPSAEINQSLELLTASQIWRDRYEKFITTMVYDDAAAIEYKNAVATIADISKGVISSLH